MASAAEARQRRIVRVVGAVQFVAVVDFMMIMPLGPDLTGPLGFEPSALGRVVAAYTVAAALAGVLGAMFLDRLDRRRGLVAGLVGLGLATASAALATDLHTLMLARAAAGALGGPVAALALSAITDAIPAERRGRAMGAVMGANALGAVLGVPLGLWLADVWRWQAPFVIVGGAAWVAALLAVVALPPMREHLDELKGHEAPWRGLLSMATRPLVREAYAMIFVVMAASFLLTPNLSAFVQHNLGLPRPELPLLYAGAGAVTLLTMRLAGRVVDRRGAFVVGAAAAVGFSAVVAAFLMSPSPLLPIGVGFVALMVSLSSRNVAVRTLATRVPGPHERARFLSLEASVRYLAAAAGAGLSSLWLETRPDGGLDGMVGLGALVVALALGILPLLRRVERAVVRQEG